MLEIRRQQVLRILGVDLYSRRSLERQTIVEKQPVEVEPLPVTPLSAAPEKEAPSTRRKSAAAKSAKKSVQEPLRLRWWQFEDLLFIEEESEKFAAEDLTRLAHNIALALGRASGLDGELHWPPGGDFEAISQAEFLQHFVDGRKESAGTEMQLLLGSEKLLNYCADLGKAHQIPALHAMLADPSLKSQTWQILKTLRRS